MDFRPLSYHEKQILNKLLAEDFPERDVIREQLDHSLVRQLDGNGTLEFHVDCDVLAKPPFRVPVEAEFEDTDGVTIHVLLHVVAGRVNELEIYKEDGSAVTEMPWQKPARIFVPR